MLSTNLYHYSSDLGYRSGAKTDRRSAHGASTRPSSRLSISVPPLSEQQRIVGILDEAFEGIATAKANAEKNLQNARALFESHLQSVFTQRGEGWVEKPLARLCDFKHGDRLQRASSSRTTAITSC